ncbi:hypothetical protein ACWKTZ_25985 [Bacillus cereus]
MTYLILPILFFSMNLVNFISPIILKQEYRWSSILIAVATLIVMTPLILFVTIYKGDPDSNMYGYVFMSYGAYPVILVLAISNIVMIVKQKKKKG